MTEAPGPTCPAERTGAASGQAKKPALQLLLGDRERAAAAARLFDDQLGWLPAVAVCSDWGALPPFNRRIEELGISLEGPARDKVRRWTSAVFLRSAASLHQGAVALSALAGAGIDAVAFKGVAAVAALYRGPRDRTLGDADVLIRRRDLEAAVDTLEQIGFRLGIECRLADHIQFSQEHPNAGNQSVSMFAPNGREVDLHWHMGRVCVETVLADARQADVYGRTIRTASDAHGFLLDVHHILRNSFELDRAVRNLIDCHHWIEALVGRQQIEVVVGQAAAWGLGAPALATVQILARFRPTDAIATSVPAFRERLLQPERQVADALTECFFLQAAAEPWSLDLLKTLDGRGLYQFLRRTMTGVASYTPRATHNDEGTRSAPPSFRRRLLGLGRALPRTRWRLVLALKGAQKRAFTESART